MCRYKTALLPKPVSTASELECGETRLAPLTHTTTFTTVLSTQQAAIYIHITHRKVCVSTWQVKRTVRIIKVWMIHCLSLLVLQVYCRLLGRFLPKVIHILHPLETVQMR
ncbi:hypothetical protein L211DRAFT_641413 [Terfezia boudieri ATCC MYA-4762]|uniref:Uncharacterized protein n=1 Tax=Terfezia boudieri ATCC MYA-4762 TaxID=1051890 RepID=A0A3N4L8T2_9PEZI|nr:hypothetical protein L211DRAFT_641352 [Terfezia boudieri ATCC MYA-4762]RPB19273.1 hypothetical protein L211DRAFT_641413 [Terfezia boudieri ATCC MYA-4762]